MRRWKGKGDNWRGAPAAVSADAQRILVRISNL